MRTKIAIVGMSMKCADAPNITALEKLLLEGHDSVKPFTEKRIMDTSIDTNRPLRQIGFIEDIDKFDYRLFGLSKAEASMMDPHHRLILESVYEAIDNTGYSIDYFNGSNSSVYLADINPEYYKLADKFEDVMVAGNSPAFAAARVARQFNLTGNALVVDTACSSSLVALHTACNELILGETDYAFVGGASLNFFPYCDKEAETSIWSSDGKSRAFSEQADGMSCGETVGCLILKRLEDALEDHDNIHAVILATAVNNNADRSSSPSAPDSISQAKVITTAWDRAGIKPEDIGFIEAHGSGTKLGDSLEVEGLTMAFNQYTNKKHICPMSTIKSNIGHSYSVSGIAGIVKAVLSMKNGKIYPSIHVKELNRMIDFENSAVYVETELKEWNRIDSKPRISAVTSLGASGTNVHIVLQEAPERNLQSDVHTDNQVITMSSMTQKGLNEMIKNMIEYLEENGCRYSLNHIACNLNMGRHHYKHRVAMVVDSVDELKQQLVRKQGMLTQEVTDDDIKNFFVLSDIEISVQQLNMYSNKYAQFATYYDECVEIKGTKEFTKEECNFVFDYAIARMIQALGINMSNCICVGMGKLVMSVLQDKMTLANALNQSNDYEKDESVNVGDKFRQLLNRRSSSEMDAFIFLSIDNYYSRTLREIAENDNTVQIITIDDNYSIANFIACLYEQGMDIDWSKWHNMITYEHIELPGYVFLKERCWIREGAWIEKQPEIVSSEFKIPDHFNMIQKSLLECWHKVIGYNEIDITKNFFDNGGDSIKATEIINFIADLTGVDLDFEDMFDFPTIESLSQYIVENMDIEQQIMLIFKNVLKIDDLSKKDSFFDLGGHSLMANQLLVQIQSQLGVALDFEDVFTHPTSEKLAQYIQSNDSKDNLFSRHPIEKVPEAELYPISEVQMQLWIMSKIKQGSAAYNSPFSLDIAGVIDPNMFSNTVLELVKRHESLRTVFVQKDNEVYQRILPIDEFKLQLDICNVNSKEEVDKIIDSDIQVEFDLTTGPLLRCKLIYIDDRTILYFNIHHIIHDGWSSKVFLNDFITIFTMLYNKQPVTLEPLSIQYKDYSVWQRNMLDNGYMKEAEQYWLNVFEDKVKPIDLCIAKRRPNQRNFMGDKVTKVVSYSIMRKIKEYCNKKGITLYMYLMGAADILMYLYSGENDVVIGSPIAGRSQAVLEKQIGYYANTIAIRNYVSDNQTVAELLDVVKENTLKSFNYQDYPFGRLVREKANARISNRNPLFDVMMVLQNTNMIVNQKLMIGTMPITEINDLGTSSLFDLHIEFTENEYGIDIALDYDVDLFERQDIIGLGSDLVELLTLLMEDQTLIKDISLRNLMSNHGISNWEMDDLLDLLNGEK